MKNAGVSLVNRAEKQAAIRALVNTSIEHCSKAVVILFMNQTKKEQNSGETIDKNAIGFTHIDAKCLTRMALTVLHNGVLSDKDFTFLTAPVERVGTRIGKYHGQLDAILPPDWTVAVENPVVLLERAKAFLASGV